MKETGKPELIRAAGGFLWRENKGSREILIIHRRRYDDWTLPKGKVKEGECLDETALREVAEESGYRAKLHSFAGGIFYYVGENPKIVLYWNMQVAAEIPQAERLSDSPDEGDEVRWLSVADALKLISYEDERELLRQQAQHGAHKSSSEETIHEVNTLLTIARKDESAMDNATKFTSTFKSGPLVLPSKWFNRLFAEPSEERLRISLELYYHEMGHLEALIAETGLHTLHGNFHAIARLLEEAKEALRHGDVDYGWGAFNTAQRIETLIYFRMRTAATDNTLQEYATSMYLGKAESLLVEGQSKLSGWRLIRMQKLLLDDKKKLKENPLLGDVLMAQRLLSEQFENSYLRLKIITRQIRFLEIIAAAALITWLGLLLRFSGVFESDSLTKPLPLSVLALIFGILGACISGILRLEKRPVHKRIPDQLESRVFMLARPLVGAVSALGVVFLVVAKIVAFGQESTGLYMAAAFAAGFSERLLKFGIDKVGGEEDTEKKDN